MFLSREKKAKIDRLRILLTLLDFYITDVGTRY
ncbi:unknown [Bacteroides sp. CAG:875]|nr:unknown [Bacteroides sp. CAG:875]